MPTLLSHFLAFGVLALPLLKLPKGPAHFSAPKWMLIDLLTMAAILSATSIRFPTLGRFRFAIMVWSLSLVLAFLIHPSHFSEVELLHFTCLSLLVAATYHAVKSSGAEKFLCLIIRYNAIGLTLVWAVFWRLSRTIPASSFANISVSDITFGYPNITGEFLGISFLLQAGGLLKGSLGRVSRLLSVAVLIGIVILLGQTACRAAILGTVAGTIILLGGRVVWCRWLSAALTIVVLLAVIWPVGHTRLAQNKRQNSAIRVWRWQNTIEMIREHPFGVGPGQFEFAYLPYHDRHGPDPEITETSLVRTPHNDYLHFTATYGIAFVLASFVLALILIRQWQMIKRNERDPPSIERRISMALFTFLAIDALFAFPLELPFSFYIAALTGGLVLAIIFPEWKEVGGRLFFCYRVGGLACLGLLAAPEIFSNTVTFRFPSTYPLVSLACEVFPDNWRQCLRKGSLEMDLEDFEGAKETAQEELRRHPTSFPAWKLLESACSALGKEEEACAAATKYDRFFGEKSSLHDLRTKHCAPRLTLAPSENDAREGSS